MHKRRTIPSYFGVGLKLLSTIKVHSENFFFWPGGGGLSKDVAPIKQRWINRGKLE